MNYLRAFIETVVSEITLSLATIKEKGANRFARTLIVALAAPLAVHILLCSPAKRKLANLDGELKAAATMASNADTYKELKDRLSLVYSLLPLPAQRSDFLPDAIKEALRSENIIATQFNPPVESETEGILVQNISINIRARFPEMLAFIDRLENSRPLIHVSSLDIQKKGGTLPGENEVTCTIGTVIFTERF
jgi:hypothetical protein